MLFIGIDPGKLGGQAVLDAQGAVQFAGSFPTEFAEFSRWLSAFACRDVHVWLEFVRASPQMGVVSAFSFGRTCGMIEGALAAYSLEPNVVTPPVWQRAMGCLSGGDKNITKARAHGLFPGLKVTHRIADALLIAEYGRRQYLKG